MLTITRRIRVEWSHCDPAGIIFNPHYHVWMNNAAHQLLEAAGFSFHAQLRGSEFRGCPLVKVEMSYLAPARLNEVIAHECTTARFGRSSWGLAHRFLRGATVLAEGTETRVWVRADPERPDGMAAAPMPEDLRAGLSKDETVEVAP